MNEVLFRCLIFLTSYLIGSVPIGYLIARWRGVADIRLHGSGATGATNAARVLGSAYFFIIFALDFFRAFVTMYMLINYTSWSSYFWLVGIALMIGNGWPIFIGFRGGKGVATALGMLTFLMPKIALFLFIIWLAVFILVRVVGIGSVALFVAMYLCAIFTQASTSQLFLCIVSLIGTQLHGANIKQYLQLLREKVKAV